MSFNTEQIKIIDPRSNFCDLSNCLCRGDVLTSFPPSTDDKKKGREKGTKSSQLREERRKNDDDWRTKNESWMKTVSDVNLWALLRNLSPIDSAEETLHLSLPKDGLCRGWYFPSPFWKKLSLFDRHKYDSFSCNFFSEWALSTAAQREEEKTAATTGRHSSRWSRAREA